MPPTPQRPPRPATQPLDQLLWDSDLEHEQVLLRQLQPRGKRVVDLRGRQDEQDDAATLEATRSRGRRRRYSIANVEQLSRQCRLTQTPSASSSHSH